MNGLENQKLSTILFRETYTYCCFEMEKTVGYTLQLIELLFLKKTSQNMLSS